MDVEQNDIIWIGTDRKRIEEGRVKMSYYFLEEVYSYHTGSCEVCFVILSYLSLTDSYVLQFTCKKFRKNLKFKKPF